MTAPKSRRRTTQWNLLFHYVSIALAIVSGVCFVPLYLRSIPLGLFGAWLATGNIVTWLTVIDPGLSTVLQQRSAVAYGEGDTAELNALLTGGVLISAAISFTVLLAGFVSSGFLFGWLNLSSEIDTGLLERAFLLAVAGTALMIFSYGITAFNQGLQSSLGIGLVYVVSTTASLLLTAILLFQGAGLLAIPAGLVARGCGLTIGNFGYLMWRYKSEGMSYRFSLSGVSGLARLMSYTFLGRGADVIAANLDAVVLTRFLGADVAPIFVLTRKASDICRTFVERPALAFMPAISHLVGGGGEARARVILLRLVRLVLWILGLIAGGLVAFNDDFVALWVGRELFAGSGVNAVFAASLVVAVLVNVLANLCFALGNIRGNSLAAFAQGLISAPLIIVGAKHWGLIGIAWAPLLAMLAVSAWYLPYAFTRLLELKRAELHALARETLCVFGSATVATLALSKVAVSSWLAMAASTSLYGIVYLSALMLSSTAARSELIHLSSVAWSKLLRHKSHVEAR